VKHARFANPVLSVLLLACLGHSAKVAAQNPPLSGCQGGSTAPTNKPGWAPGTTVDVYIDPATPGYSQVKAAFNNWTAKPANGGNRDGQITKADAIFGSLLLWQDVNRNGISEGEELHTLKQLALKSIDLDYKESYALIFH